MNEVRNVFDAPIFIIEVHFENDFQGIIHVTAFTANQYDRRWI